MRIDSSIEERAILLAQYIIDSKDTVRGTAKSLGFLNRLCIQMWVNCNFYGIPKTIELSKVSLHSNSARVKLAVRI